VSTDPDQKTQSELLDLIRAAEHGNDEALDQLNERFCGPLKFGTAGIRGIVGAGESYMNVAVVTRVTYGLLTYLLEKIPDAASRGVIIGRDARHGSEVFQKVAGQVARAMGVRTMLILEPSPTPLTAFALTYKKAAAGVVVTASHNPPAYNGYKVYWENGAQIVPPHDQGIAARIQASPAANEITLGDEDFEIIDDVATKYIDEVVALKTLDVAADQLNIVYTAMHGVGTKLVSKVFAQAGFTQLSLVDAQCEPDPDFPTVDFPNPEEPGALDLAMAKADEVQADIILANDPDADRLAAVIYDCDRMPTALTGNEMGLLLGHHLLTTRPEGGADRLVMTTVVSSTQLGHVAAQLGVRYGETLTGFKWIANKALLAEQSGAQFLFGFEEAIGFSVGPLVRDKDGVSAALIFAELAADCKAKGETVLDRLAAIRREFGYFLTRQYSVNLAGQKGADRIASIMSSLRKEGLKELAGRAVVSTWDLQTQLRTKADGSATKDEATPPTNALIYQFDNGRAAIRPSGTEPKIKLYLEVVKEVSPGASLESVRAQGEAELDAFVAAFRTRVGLI
jgi:phosphomannomutase